jgi:hypothetical protein
VHERRYDFFELPPDGTPRWRGFAFGHEGAFVKLKELSAQTTNEILAIDLQTKDVIATANKPQET